MAPKQTAGETRENQSETQRTPAHGKVSHKSAEAAGHAWLFLRGTPAEHNLGNELWQSAQTSGSLPHPEEAQMLVNVFLYTVVPSA